MAENDQHPIVPLFDSVCAGCGQPGGEHYYRGEFFHSECCPECNEDSADE